ncbi:hypothetical protein [Micromonospora gifhornensis]|uniref:hypothetical protein n=1 Tax=Micromonospora gifhornensis TaxID=84594 RepID=UPI003668F001
MAIAADRGDLRYAVEFLATPMIVDLLRAVRNSTAANAYLDVTSDDDVVQQAIEVLAANGTVTCTPGDSARPGRQRLSLTSKGRRVCDLVDELVGTGDDFTDTLIRDYTWLPEESTRGYFSRSHIGTYPDEASLAPPAGNPKPLTAPPPHG